MAVYDPTTPAIAQNDPWSCAPTSARWAMTAWGRHPTEQWFESTLLAEGVVSRDDGLLDASGAGLARFLTEQYGEFNFAARSNGHVSFDDVKSASRQTPVLIGGRQWGHWSGVRSYDPATDTLQLANPANGWQGIHQTMSRQQFDALGPFSMVVVTWQDPVAPTPPAPAPAPAPKPPAPAGFVVGDGILKAMTKNGETPASNEEQSPGGGWSEAYSSIGRRYTWVASLGQCFVYEGWHA
jgi:hypothetical protein